MSKVTTFYTCVINITLIIFLDTYFDTLTALPVHFNFPLSHKLKVLTINQFIIMGNCKYFLAKSFDLSLFDDKQYWRRALSRRHFETIYTAQHASALCHFKDSYTCSSIFTYHLPFLRRSCSSIVLYEPFHWNVNSTYLALKSYFKSRYIEKHQTATIMFPLPRVNNSMSANEMETSSNL